jgi:hypothetical protein
MKRETYTHNKFAWLYIIKIYATQTFGGRSDGAMVFILPLLEVLATY